MWVGSAFHCRFLGFCLRWLPSCSHSRRFRNRLTKCSESTRPARWSCEQLPWGTQGGSCGATLAPPWCCRPSRGTWPGYCRPWLDHLGDPVSCASRLISLVCSTKILAGDEQPDSHSALHHLVCCHQHEERLGLVVLLPSERQGSEVDVQELVVAGLPRILPLEKDPSTGLLGLLEHPTLLSSVPLLALHWNLIGYLSVGQRGWRLPGPMGHCDQPMRVCTLHYWLGYLRFSQADSKPVPRLAVVNFPSPPLFATAVELGATRTESGRPTRCRHELF